MEKPRELFETELSEIREELLRLGVRPRESLQQTVQKELLEEWQQTGRHWLDRMQSEMALWGELGSKLATIQSAAEALEAYGKCVEQHMKMTAEDAQRLLKACRRMLIAW
jgi:DNA-binding ferritin-like protein